jgi:type II secretory pathway component GspD/PulD (secretin)
MNLELEPPKSGATNNLLSQFIPLLSSLGVDLVPPKYLLCNESQGLLLANATLQDLDAIEFILQELNQSPPQLTVECKFVEFSLANAPAWFKGLWTNQTSVVQPTTSSSTNLAGPELVSILTPMQAREILRDFETRPGCDLLAAPKVTTLSGRQAVIKTVEVIPLMVSREEPNEKDGKPNWQYFEVGPAVDLVPFVAADRVTISMTVIPSILEFLGYESARRSQHAQPPPMFRFRRAPTRVTLWDGQTALVGLGPAERLKKGSQKGGKFYRAVLVTAVIIDPAGNRVHTEDDLPFRNGGVPPQQ